MPKQPSLKKNAAYSVTYSVLRIVFPLVTYPYVSRIIGPSGIGTVSYIQSIATYFYSFATLGLPLYGARAIARARDDKVAFDRLFTELVILAGILTSVATLAYFALPVFFARFRSELFLHASFGLVVFTNFAQLDWFYRGIENYRYITIRNLFVRLLSVAAIFVVIREADDYRLYGLIWVAGAVVANLWNLAYSFKFGRLTFQGFRPFRHVKPLIPSFAMVITGTLYNGLDTVMLGSMIDDGGVSVGYYALANRVVRIGMSILIAGGTVVAPRIAYYYEKGDHDGVDRILRLNVWYTLFFGLPMVLGLWTLAGDVVWLFGGSEFQPAILTLRILAVQLLIIALVNIISFQILYARDREHQVVVSLIFAASAAVVLNLLLIPLYRQNGAALGTLVARIIELVIQGVFGFALLKKALFNRESGKILLVSLLLFGAIQYSHFLLVEQALVVRFVVVVVGSVPLYLLLAKAFRLQILKRVLEGFTKKLGRRSAP